MLEIKSKAWMYPSLRIALAVSCLYTFSMQIQFLTRPVITTPDNDVGYQPMIVGNHAGPGILSNQSMLTTLKTLWDQMAQEPENAQGNTYMVLGNFVRRQSHPTTRNQPHRLKDVALVTHCAVKNKMDNLVTQLENWNGPASVAVYIDDGDIQIDPLIELLQTQQELLRFSSVHIFMEYHGSRRNQGYPHNLLRNLAMDQSDMSYALAVDVDLIPGPPNCYEHIRKSFEANDFEVAKLMKKYRTAVVVPSFDVLPRSGERKATPDQLPKSNAELMRKVKEGRVIPFHSRTYVPGHNATDFEKWYTFQEGYELGNNETSDSIYYPIQYQENFEPYVIVHKEGIPRYWEHFRGFGYNKRTWLMELHRAGYDFAVLTQQYLVHLAHRSFLNDYQRKKNWQKFSSFVDYIDAKYPLVDGKAPQGDRTFVQFAVGEKPKNKQQVYQRKKRMKKLKRMREQKMREGVSSNNTEMVKLTEEFELARQEWLNANATLSGIQEKNST